MLSGRGSPEEMAVPRLRWFALSLLVSFSGPLHAGTLQLCTSKAEPDCVISGDSIRQSGVNIRIEDIDAPNIAGYKCATEYGLGKRAAARLLELLNIGPFDIILVGDRAVDPIGRQLRSLYRNGQSLGMRLVAEGLAVRWTGKHGNWCP